MLVNADAGFFALICLEMVICGMDRSIRLLGKHCLDCGGVEGPWLIVAAILAVLT